MLSAQEFIRQGSTPAQIRSMAKFHEVSQKFCEENGIERGAEKHKQIARLLRIRAKEVENG